ncbi:hypothetical protein [Cryobacterium serini]|uniref:Uncharacterized protein n=1 Tax=Cryobacterium serini TaxID=1259201 RepID=A0A4R9BKX9_9MICO|nr:hypothetical protein [Cryobacterium serini]TFD86644.1 hypothetical protein E3T51_11940 [Cryobacterium serini]
MRHPLDGPEGSRLARTRWFSALSAVHVAVATWSAIERDWFTIWAMWALMLGYLIAVITPGGCAPT